MALALFLLLVAGYGGAFLTARRWLRTGSSAAVFPWAAGLVAVWPVLRALGRWEGEGFHLGGLVLISALWWLTAVLLVFVGRAWADREPRPDARPGESRLGNGTFTCALVFLAAGVLVGVLEAAGVLGIVVPWHGSLLGGPWALLVAAGALNLACFFAVMLERSTDRRGPGWFLASVFGFAAVAVYSLQAVFEVIRGAIEFL